jgi:cytochrome P450
LTSGRERFEVHGYTFSSVVGCVSIIATIEPDNIKTMLASKFEDFDVGVRRARAFSPLLGNGIFCADSTRWQYSRALIRPSFTRSQLADLDLLERHVTNFFQLIPGDGSTVDLHELFFRLTMDTATEFLLGSSIYTLVTGNSEENQAFVNAINYSQRCLIDGARLGGLLPFYRDSKFDASNEICHKFIEKFVFKLLDSRKSVENGVTPNITTNRYVFRKELAKVTNDPNELRDQVLNLLLAGRDTTASLLSNVFFMLSRRKDFFFRLQGEVAKLGGERPSFERLKQMKYLHSVINECKSSEFLWPSGQEI